MRRTESVNDIERMLEHAFRAGFWFSVVLNELLSLGECSEWSVLAYQTQRDEIDQILSRCGVDAPSWLLQIDRTVSRAEITKQFVTLFPELFEMIRFMEENDGTKEDPHTKVSDQGVDP